MNQPVRRGVIVGGGFAGDIRRERAFTIDDIPLETGAYGGRHRSTTSENPVP